MRPVAIRGIGKTAFGAFPDRDLRSLAAEAVRKALDAAATSPSAVEAFYLGNFAGPSFSRQSHLAPYVAHACGLGSIPATRFEAACASSGAAFFHAWQAVAAGLYDHVVVCGVEKMTSVPTAQSATILAMAGDLEEAVAGATFPSLFALIARRHMYEFGTTREHLATVAVKNHANGARNPLAHFQKAITLEQALSGKPVADPLTLFDCSPISDGAAAVVLSASGPVRVLGIGQSSGPVALSASSDITSLPSIARAARQAYAMSKLGPADIDFAEVHDCFTIAEIVALEELGFCAKGEGGPYTASGATAFDGARPVNRSGGLKSKGHPVGATGVGQICDIYGQLIDDRTRAVGLAQNLGGSGATSVVTILGRAA